MREYLDNGINSSSIPDFVSSSKFNENGKPVVSDDFSSVKTNESNLTLSSESQQCFRNIVFHLIVNDPQSEPIEHSQNDNADYQALLDDYEAFHQSKNNFYEQQTSFKKSVNKNALTKNEVKDLLISLDQQFIYLNDRSNELLKTLIDEFNRDIMWHTETNHLEVRENDFILAFLSKEIGAYQRLNSTLDINKYTELHNQILDYLVMNIQARKIERLKNLVDESYKLVSSQDDQVKNKRQEILIELNTEFSFFKLGSEKAISLLYDPLEYPEFLVFEYKTGMVLRKRQVEKLIDIIRQFESQPSTEHIHQMIMGFGKTKVLLPILLNRLADGEHLSMVIVPDSLLHDVVKDLTKKSSTVFDQVPFVFEFDRRTSLEYRDLDMFEKRLNASIRYGQPVITTSKSMHSLRLRFIEELFKQDHSLADHSVKQLRRILAIFKDKGKVFFDEADTILNCKNEVNFSMGEPIRPKHIELELLVKLHSIIRKNKDKNCSYSSIISFALSKDAYCLGPVISRVPSKMGAFTLKSFLDGNDISIDQFTFTEDQKSLLFLLRGQCCCDLLDITYKRKLYENYGPSVNTNEFNAVPYIFLNTPSLTSRFDQIHETLNYTIQMYHELGEIQDWILEGHLLEIHHRLKDEQSKGISFEESTAKQTFDLFFPSLNFTHIKDKTNFITIINEIKTLFKNDHSKLDYYLIHYVLPKITTDGKTLNSNSFDIVDMFREVHGFTGTPWNSGAFHERLDCTIDKGTDGESFFNIMKDGVRISTLEKDDSYLDVINQLSLQESTRAFIDCGALMKGAENTKIAENLLRRVQKLRQDQDYSSNIKSIIFYHSNKQSVGFFNEKHEFIINDFNKEKDVKNERFTFYDHAHTIGSDIDQIDNAQAILTVSENVKQRDLFQAMWRMRGLSKGQTLHVLVNKKLKGILSPNNQPKISDIIKHVTKNQYDQKLDQLIQTAEMRFRHIEKQERFEKLLQCSVDNPSILNQFVKEKNINPQHLYNTIKKILPKKDLIQQWEASVAKADSQEREPKIKKLKSLALKCLPNEVTAPVISYDQTAEAQVQNEIEQENQKETQVYTEHVTLTYPELTKFTYDQVLNSLATPYHFYLDIPYLKFSNIKASINYLDVAKPRFKKAHPDDEDKKPRYQLKCRHVLAWVDYHDKKHLIMLHNADVEYMLHSYADMLRISSNEEITKNDHLKRCGIFNIANKGTICEHNWPYNDSKGKGWFEDNPEFQKLVVEVKLFNGQIIFTQDDRQMYFDQLSDFKKSKWFNYINQNVIKEDFKDSNLYKWLKPKK